MSFPAGSGTGTSSSTASTAPSFPLYTNPGYSSPSDVETSNTLTDYSETEAGYSSTTSTGFEYITGGFQRINSVPTYASQRYQSSSKSPPAQLIGSIPSSAGGTTTPTSPTAHGQTYQRIARFVGPPPVALACTECRSRHLKCDAGTPVCSRCLADKRECNYVKSRRGWKGTRRKKVAATTTESTTQPSEAASGEAGPSTAKGKRPMAFPFISSFLSTSALATTFCFSLFRTFLPGSTRHIVRHGGCSRGDLHDISLSLAPDRVAALDTRNRRPFYIATYLFPDYSP
jgi:hypothetical protein